MPAISVIVPVYNVEPYLHRCVESILQQTFTDFELILVDDGSPDNCPAICDQYAAQDKRVHVIHQKNGGLSAARNAGIDWAFAHSDSEWIAFIDSDDWVHASYLKKLYEMSISLEVEIGVCAFQRVELNNVPRPIKFGNIKKISALQVYNMDEQRILFTISCAKIYKKELWKQIRFPVGKFHEDAFTTYKLIFLSQHIGLIEAEMYYYYINDDSIMNKAWTPGRMDALEAIQEQICFFRDQKITEGERQARKSYLWALYGQLTQLENISPRYKEYEQLLRTQLKKSLREYRKKMDLPITKYGYIYDMAYPFWMRQYWRVQKILKLLHLK